MSIVIHHAAVSAIPYAYNRNVLFQKFANDDGSVTIGVSGEDKAIVGRDCGTEQEKPRLVYNDETGEYRVFRVATLTDDASAESVITELCEAFGTKGDRGTRRAKLSPAAAALFDVLPMFDRKGMGRWDRVRSKGMGLGPTQYRVCRLADLLAETAGANAVRTVRKDRQAARAAVNVATLANDATSVKPFASALASNPAAIASMRAILAAADELAAAALASVPSVDASPASV